MNKQQVILVNEKDEAIGVLEKMEVHQKGLLHRAFSIFIFDSKGRMLIQKRSSEKYHGALLWTNACCSHPYPHEKVEEAAKRRLQEELGFSTTLIKMLTFIYRAEVENNLIEHEYDHVFFGQYEGIIEINRKEVEAYTYTDMDELKLAITKTPELFTSWFKIIFLEIEKLWAQKYCKTEK